jgi:hypothetical protein
MIDRLFGQRGLILNIKDLGKRLRNKMVESRSFLILILSVKYDCPTDLIDFSQVATAMS